MQDTTDPGVSRRKFLVESGLLLAAGSLFGAACSGEPERQTQAGPIPPTEDLMQEHGVLRRIMLIYDETGRRLQQGEEFPVPVLTEANLIVRRFMQDYHEMNEQFHLFNHLASAGKLVELVAILYQQHLAGRKLIDKVNILSTGDNLSNPATRQQVAALLHTFNQVYRRHAAWEDTLVFPAFRSITSAEDFAALGETFDKEEKKKFGSGGFEKMLAQVADLEQKLGIYNLQQFTPKL